MEGFRYLEGVATLKLDAARCTGCTLCEQVCPHRVFAVIDGKAKITDGDLCMECGACVMNCPSGAIAVTPGVGCATAILGRWLSGSKPACGCG